GAGAAALLKRMARDGDAQVRAAVASGMGRTPSIADLRILREYAGDGDDMVRVAAAGALGEVPGKEAADALWACASDASNAVRGTALAALVRRGEKDAVTAWLRQDPRSAQLRTEVAIALDQGGDASQALALLAETDGLSREGLALAGWCAVELKLWDAARLYLQRASLAGEPHATAWDWAVLARALEAAHEGRPEAEGLLRAAVESAGDPAFASGNAAYLLADSLLLPTLALEFAHRAAATPDPSPDVIDTLGWAQLRAGHAAEAERTLLSIRTPPGPEGWLHRAAAQAANDRAAEAAASLREALLARPALAPRVRSNPLLAPLLQRPELETWK
ncbi:MAG: HEAT repeat domain-containing protein, partial [Planctomycetia bacterium]|nr:HEAT repeat domain-containing protein [Planctomycetia bacterium]